MSGGGLGSNSLGSGNWFGCRAGEGAGTEDSCAQHEGQTGTQSRKVPRGRTNRRLRYWLVFMHEKYHLRCSCSTLMNSLNQ